MVPAPVVGENLKIVAHWIVEGARARIRDVLEYGRAVEPLALVQMLSGNRLNLPWTGLIGPIS